MTNIIPVSSLLFAESVTSLYPILIKSIDSNLLTQVFARMGTMSIASSLFASKGMLYKVISNPKFYLISVLQLIHILASYQGFKNLNAGTSITIFYIYPILNVIIKSIIKGEPLNKNILLLLLIAFIGVIVISIPAIINETDKNKKMIFYIGVIAMLFSALTESITYHFYKEENQHNPFDSLITLYGFGFLLLFLFSPLFLQRNNIEKLIMFNLILGLIGFVTRFYSIPRVSTELYSALSFVGVVSAYIFGWYFDREQITIYHIIGTVLILFSVRGVYNLNPSYP